MAEENVNVETYQGPSKFSSMVTGAMSGVLVAFTGALAVLNKSFRAGGLTKKQNILTWVAMGITGIIGGMWGSARAKAGEEQFNVVQAENEQLKSVATAYAERASELQGQVAGLTNELATDRKSFTESHAKHHAEHQAKLAEHAKQRDEYEAKLAAHTKHQTHASAEHGAHVSVEHGAHADNAELKTEHAASPVSIEEPPIKEPVIKEPVIKTPTIAPAPHGSHVAAVEASQHEAAMAQAER